MLHLTINGRPTSCDPGASLLAAVRGAGGDVPTLCDDPRLRPFGACRLCVVQVIGRPQPVTACTTPAEEGMTVFTHPAEIEEARRTTLQLLARRYPREPFDRFPDKPFHRLISQYGLEPELSDRPGPEQVDDTHPYVRVDMSRCVHCFRCVRVCDEVQGQFVWKVWNRGGDTLIRPDSGTSLLASACVGCGTCADACPTGAIEDQAAFQGDAPDKWTRTVCPYCGVGCELSVGTRGGAVVGVKPVTDAPVNRGHLCVKGRYAFGFNHAADRVTEPMIRTGAAWARAGWDEAISRVAEGFRRALERHGPGAVGVLGSARATNEENYLAQKFARVVLGTNNVDCCARVCHAPSAEGMKRMLGTGAATNSFEDIERAASIMVCGANATENHPVVGARIKQAALRGAPLVVIDPRRIELARYAAVHLALRPGTNVLLLNAMAHAVVDEGLVDREFVGSRTSGWEAYEQLIRDWPPERVAPIVGVEAGRIREAARIYATAKPAMCFHGLGVTEHAQGTDGVTCLVNLALLTGNLGRRGGGVNPLRGQNNVQGAALMGCDPGSLTGAVPVSSHADRFATAWNAALPSAPGLTLMRMMDAARQGRFKALWAIGYDVALTNPNAGTTREALSSLDLLVVQDLFHNEVAKLASVFLPAASSFEKDGTFMNAERRVQRVRRATPPLGNCRPDWQIICDVARAMGKADHFPFRSPQEIWDEIRSVWPAGRGISYDRLDHGGLQWPCPSEDHPGTAVLHVQTFTAGPRAPLQCVPYLPPHEAVSAMFPFVLITGRTLVQFNAGTMTQRTPNRLLRQRDLLVISPADAKRLDIRDGDPLRLRSRYGQAVLPACVDESVQPGHLFTTFHDAGIVVNELTGDERDHAVDTPQYKLTAVNVEPIGAAQ